MKSHNMIKFKKKEYYTWFEIYLSTNQIHYNKW